MIKNLSDLVFCFFVTATVSLVAFVWSGDLFTAKKEVSFVLCVVSDTAEPKHVMVYPKAGSFFQAQFKPTKTTQGDLPCVTVKSDLPIQTATSMMVMNYGKNKLDEVRIFTPDAATPIVVHDAIDKGRFTWSMLPASEVRATITVQPATSRTAAR